MPLLDKIDSDFYRAKRIARHLRENYKFEIDFDSMTLSEARRMKKTVSSRLGTLKENRGDLNNRDGVLYQLVQEALSLFIRNYVGKLTESDEPSSIEDDSIDEAEVIIAAQSMSESLQKIVEDVAEMQVQDLLPLVDRMKEEIGQDKAAQFERSVDEALANALETLKETKGSVDNAILAARGIGSNDMESSFEEPGDIESDDEMGDEVDDDFETDEEDSDSFDEPTSPEPRELKPE